jgi:hypothetical protein
VSIRVGESWRGRNGRRYWVSMPLHDLVALGILGFWLWPFVLTWLLVKWSLWLAVELVLLPATAACVLWQVHQGRGTGRDIAMESWNRRLWWFGLRHQQPGRWPR